MSRDGDFKIGGVDCGTTSPIVSIVRIDASGFACAFSVLEDQVIDGHSYFALACDGFNHLDKPRTWWQRYTRFVGPGIIKARCRKILLRQIDEWTPHET